MNLTHLSWPLGWTPSADAVNGDPTGLVRMDNLTQEENGAISLIAGRVQLTSSLPDYVYSLYSTVLGGNNPVYAALNEAGRLVVRSMSGNFNDTVTVLSDGGFITAFGSALGAVLVVCGSQAVKDDGSGTFRNLGLKDQLTGPTIVIQEPAIINLSTGGTWSISEGVPGIAANTGAGPNPIPFTSPGSSAASFTLDPVTLRATVTYTYASPLDTTAFGSGVTDNYLTDIINFLAQLNDSSQFTDIRVQFILDNHPAQPFNYYWEDFLINDGQFNIGLTQQSIIGDQRQNWSRQGTSSSHPGPFQAPNHFLDWTHVTAVQFTLTGIQQSWAVIDQITVTGGPQGNLLGVYQYATVAVYDNGIYQAKSALSPFTNNILVQNSFVMATLTCTDTEANEVWLFRRSMISSTDPIYQTFISQNKVPANLNQWYLVAQGAPGAIVEDNTSDIVALEQDIVANEFLQSIQDLIVSDPIVCMEGMYYTRMLYVSESTIYLSDPLNPDAIDQRYSVRAFAGATEKNLWLKKIAPSQLVLATSREHYLITGTLEALPDGTLDVVITPIGEKYPSLSADVCNGNGVLFYPAADGIRATNGGTSTLISQGIRLLWQGSTRFGVPGVAIQTQETPNLVDP